MEIQQIQDKMAITKVLDQFSMLADVKDVNNQLLLFTENAIVENYANGQFTGSMTGRKNIGSAFSSYLANFSTVYHMNGQQVIDIKENKATSTSYCLVKLIGKMNGNDVKFTHYIIYNDEFVKQNGQWLIAKRKANFVLTENS